jgi:hypothetical protein
MKRIVIAVILAGCLALARWPMGALAQIAPTTAPVKVGERIPSEDAVLKDFHSLGLIDGHVNIFRCACPVRDIADAMATTRPSDANLAAAKTRMQRLYDLGIRTDISFQSATSDESKTDQSSRAIDLERAAAALVGITFINDPIANSGTHSLQDMTDAQVMALVDAESAKILASARDGGVVFHCTAGHDRTGIVAAYIRIKYEHWPVDQAIDEMRRLGHNWVKFSANGGISSWHEDHLRAIAKMLAAPAGTN